MSEEIRLFRALAAADAGGVLAQPGAVLVRSGGGGLLEILACGRADEVERHEAAPRARRVQLPRSVLLPGLVNAHTHLDLTHIGPRPFDAEQGFAGWARMIVSERLRDSDALRESVRDGVRRSLAGGVMAVGDIAGVMQHDPINVLRESGLLGVSFVEYFGVGSRQEEMIGRVSALMDAIEGGTSAVRVGLQPHAPYTAGLRLFAWTAAQGAQRGVPVCTHLAETATEREFISRGGGAFRRFLESMGFWDDSVLEEIGRGLTPIAHLADALHAARWLVAHVNDCDEEGMSILARTGTSVAYCPRSSAYFRNHESCGPHRYRDMLGAGINVCLGTDSIVNLPREGSDRISTLDETRFLFARDAADPVMLLRMATVNGARALGLDESLFTLSAGPIAGLIAVDVAEHSEALHGVMRSQGPPRVLVTPRGWGDHPSGAN